MLFHFTYQGPLFPPGSLRYNPHDDLIFPSVIRVADLLPSPLAAYYLYYAPHDAPGGICLAYSDNPSGPWTELTDNPIVGREWQPHYEVSHVSSPHVIWIKELSRFYLYFHGENDTTRLASSADGIRFDYEGVVLTTAMFDKISEASYARVFRFEDGPGGKAYGIFFMGNNEGTRRIYSAWSADGKTFQPERRPLVNLPPGTDVTQVGGPFLFRWQDRNLILFHGDKTPPDLSNLTTDIYAVDVGPDYRGEDHLGVVLSRTQIAADNARVSDPFILSQNGEQFLFFSAGGRLKQFLASARLE